MAKVKVSFIWENDEQLVNLVDGLLSSVYETLDTFVGLGTIERSKGLIVWHINNVDAETALLIDNLISVIAPYPALSGERIEITVDIEGVLYCPFCSWVLHALGSSTHKGNTHICLRCHQPAAPHGVA